MPQNALVRRPRVEALGPGAVRSPGYAIRAGVPRESDVVVCAAVTWRERGEAGCRLAQSGGGTSLAVVQLRPAGLLRTPL